MGKKYIVEIGRLERLYKASIGAKGMPNMTWLSPEVDLTPYTEPDLEQVRMEAYDEGWKEAENHYDDGYSDGYDAGLDDAWKAVRKICCSVTAGGLNYNTLDAVFGSRYPEHIVDTFTASEVIERLKQFEQKQEESKKEQSVIVEDVMRQYLNLFCHNAEGCAKCPLNTSDFTCGRGRHFFTDNPVPDEEVRRAYAKVVKEK